jgi:lysophospholipase L1-like esterase
MSDLSLAAIGLAAGALGAIEGLYTPAGLMAREGYQLTGSTLGWSNAAGAVAVGFSFGGIAPGPNQLWYVESIAMSSLIDMVVRVQVSNGNLIANAASAALGSYMVGPNYGNPIIPINAMVREGESISFVCQTAISSGAGTDTLQFRAGALGHRLTNDLSFENKNTWLAIGDSITNTTGPTYGTEFYHSVIQQWLYSQGKGYRLILKGDGGWATSHALIAQKRRVFDVAPPSIVSMMLGTNETSLANFQANFPSLVAYLRGRYPKARKVFFSPPPRQGTLETTVMQPIRSYISSYVAGLSDNTCYYVGMGSAYSIADDTNFNTVDGTSSGSRVHPNALGHAAMAAVAQASEAFSML